MASVGKSHSCPLAQTPETKLQIRHEPCSSGELTPIENEIVDACIDHETIELQRPHIVAVGRGPTKLEIEHHVSSGHAQRGTWCDAYA